MADGATLSLELDAGDGDAVAVVWDLEALAAIDARAARPFAVEALDDRRWELARLLWGVFGDGRLLAVAALRPFGAPGHGAEAVRGALVREGEPVILDEVLLSTEYDASGEVRRVGLELYETPQSLPTRPSRPRKPLTQAS